MKISAILAAASISLFSVGPAISQGFEAGADVFDHNGSTIVAQYKYGNLRYMDVKPSLRGLVDRGMAAFSGNIERRGKAHGTAYVFKKGCPFIPYEVSGQYDPSIPGYVLTGKYPVRSKKGCDVVSWSSKGANARLVFVDITELERRDVAAKKAGEDAYVEQVYDDESDPNWFDGFISSEELEARQKKGK
jgi:hypothetical protein